MVELLYYDSKLRKPKKSRRLIDLLKPWLDRFGLAEDVRIEPLQEGLSSLTLKSPHTKFDINVSDSGFGISQVIPVIVECLYAPSDSTILIEQPEIHVHPKVQADLADLFIETSKTHTVIVETHSEHILLRIQRRIAEGTFSARDITIYYFEPSPDGTKVKSIP